MEPVRRPSTTGSTRWDEREREREREDGDGWKKGQDGKASGDARRFVPLNWTPAGLLGYREIEERMGARTSSSESLVPHLTRPLLRKRKRRGERNRERERILPSYSRSSSDFDRFRLVKASRP